MCIVDKTFKTLSQGKMRFEKNHKFTNFSIKGHNSVTIKGIILKFKLDFYTKKKKCLIKFQMFCLATAYLKQFFF